MEDVGDIVSLSDDLWFGCWGKERSTGCGTYVPGFGDLGRCRNAGCDRCGDDGCGHGGFHDPCGQDGAGDAGDEDLAAALADDIGHAAPHRPAAIASAVRAVIGTVGRAAIDDWNGAGGAPVGRPEFAQLLRGLLRWIWC